MIASLPYLLLVLIGVYLPLQVFQILALKIWQNQGGLPWDVEILTVIHQTARSQLDVLAVTLTKFGSFWTVLPIFSAIALVLLLLRKWRLFAYLIVTAAGSTILNRTVKEFMHRVRPQLWNSSSPELDYAFPSGHAMTSMTLAIILIVLAWKTRSRLAVIILGSLFVLAIGWTRLYLGVHFPSDVLAGWMVALAWAMGVTLLLKPYAREVGEVRKVGE